MFFRSRKKQSLKSIRKVCPYPFARMELNNNDLFVPCCSDWLTDEYFELKPGKNRWNGPAAQELRGSILDGSYRYCRTEVCKFKSIDLTNEKEEGISEAILTVGNRKAALTGKIKMPDGPTSFTVLNDARCNLACPSCRVGHISKLTAPDEMRLKQADTLLKKYRSSVEILKVAGDGEVFFSPWLQSVVKQISPSTHPRIQKINILSNGLLFNEAMYLSLMPGAQYIHDVSISVDAGNQPTYRKVRGGSWEKLVKNLYWIGEQRAKNTFKYFQMNFAVQDFNFESIPDFIQLARDVGACDVKLSPLLPFKRMALKFEQNAVHLPSHPRHLEFSKIWKRYQNDPFVRWSLPRPESQD